MDLFTSQIDSSRQHPVFKQLLNEKFAPERAVLTSWAEEFKDRDGKFVQEFQMTFESGFWELYINAALRCWGLQPNMSLKSPDFVIEGPQPLCIEAAIAKPAQGRKSPINYSLADIPDNFTQFNVEASIRICNSFDKKVRRYREYYSTLNHVTGRPFVIAIAPFDRPLSHLAADRPVFAALYGLYSDEAETLKGASSVVSYNIESAKKSKNSSVQMGLFCDAKFSDVSAVIYSPLAIWGKMRAMAKDSSANTVYITLHPNEGTITPRVQQRFKHQYNEHLLDGVYVMHNPFARHPIPSGVLSHPRISEVYVDSNRKLMAKAPDDFLLSRILISVYEELA